MPVSFEFLRGVLGVLCVLFAHMAGRSAVAVRKGQAKLSRLYGWILRALACAVVVAVRQPVDPVIIGVWVLAAAAFAAGWWAASRSRPEQDLTHEIFPK